MTTQEKVFYIMVLSSVAWVVFVLVFRLSKRSIRQIITVNESYKEDIIKKEIMAPREFVVNLVMDRNDIKELDLKIFADMAVNWKDLKAGNYKVHEKKPDDIIISSKEEKEDASIELLHSATQLLSEQNGKEIESRAEKDFLEYFEIENLFKEE